MKNPILAHLLHGAAVLTADTTPDAAASVTYDDPEWGNLTRSSVGLSGMAGDALVHYANAPVD